MRKISLIIIFFLSACNTNITKNNKITFTKVIELKGEQILTDAIGIRALSVVDDTFIVVKRMRPPYFSIYGQKSHALLSTFGNRGNGPKDFLAPSIQKSNDLLSNTIWVLDRAKKKNILVNLGQIISSNQLAFYDEEKLPDSLDLINCFYLNKTERLCYDAFYELSIFNIVTKKFSNKHSPIFCHSFNIKSEEQKRAFNFRYPVLSPSNSHVAIVSDNMPQIDLYEIKSNKKQTQIGFIKTILTDDLPQQKISDQDVYEDNYTAFNYGACCNNNFVFILNIDQKNSEIQEVSKSISIQVINWTGESVALFNINEYLNYIAVDRNNKYIYGVDYMTDKIFRYQIGNYINQNF
jgi:hypothetical protein